MSAQAKKLNAEIEAAEKKLADLNRELELDLLQSGVDVVGIFDPTPYSDATSAGISLARGDAVGFGLSLISAFPYLGDLIAKSSKAARLAKNMDRLKKSVTLAVEQINAWRKRVRETAAAAARAKKKAKAAGKSVDDALLEKCAKELDPGDNPFGTRLPADGFPPGKRGDGPWTPDASTPYGQEVLNWQKKNGIAPGTPIEFKQGFPDFSPYAKQNVKIDMTGVDYDDFKAANNAMKKVDPNWQQPKDMTWHHSEDGTTMMLVPSELNKIPHTGGAALSKVPGY